MLTSKAKLRYQLLVCSTLLLALAGVLASTPESAQARVPLTGTVAKSSRGSDGSTNQLQPLSIARTCAGCGHNVVTAGDTLYDIAVRFGVPGGWPALYAANRRLLGRNPDLLRVGVTVRVPETRRSVAVLHRRTRIPPRATAAAATQPETTTPATTTPATTTPATTTPATTTPATAQPSDTGAASTRQWLPLMLLAAGLVLAALLGKETRWSAAAQRIETRLVPATRPVLHVTDFDRLMVTRLEDPATIVVCRPPWQDPEQILRAARVVLPMEEYRILADHLASSATTRPWE
jgi:cell division septation protein DedD